MAHAFTPPEVCSVCGENVPRGARACPGCGADERSGWDEDATRYDGLDLPDSAYADENTERAARRTHGGGFWPAFVIGVLAALIAGLLLFH